MSRPSELPGRLAGLARSLQLAYRAEPRLLVASFALMATSWIPMATIALWLKFLADGVTQHRDGQIAAAAAGLAGSGSDRARHQG